VSKRIEEVNASNRRVFNRGRLKSLIPDITAATTIKQVEQIFKREKFDLSWIETKVPRPAAEQEAKWGPAVAAFIEKMEIGRRLEGAEEFAAIVEPVLDPLDTMRSNRIEEEIDRAIKRLVQVKTHKGLFGGGMPASKVIDVSPQKEITGPKRKRSTATKGTSASEEIAKPTKQNWESEPEARADGKSASQDFGCGSNT
jgi:Ribonuclease G/E